MLAEQENSAAPTGLGGWLILPILGLIHTTISHGGRALLPQSLEWPYEEASPFDRMASAVFALAALGLLALALRKSRWFPKAFIALCCVSMVGQSVRFALDAGAELIPLGFNRFTIRPILSALAPPLIWVPYMLRSRRVANTFTT